MSIFWIKIIATVTMLIDHIGCFTPFEGWEYLRMIGRIAFPLYAFMLVQGFLHTRSRARYLAQILILALLSQPIYTKSLSGVWWKWDGLNILFTLSLGLCAMWLLELARDRAKKRGRAWWLWTLLLCTATGLVLLAGEYLQVDYGWKGLLLIVLFYLSANARWAWCPISWLFAFRNQLLTWDWHQPVYQRCIFGGLAFIPLMLYNGRPGPKPKNKLLAAALKYGFYLFYPLHLAVLALIFG